MKDLPGPPNVPRQQISISEHLNDILNQLRKVLPVENGKTADKVIKLCVLGFQTNLDGTISAIACLCLQRYSI